MQQIQNISVQELAKMRKEKISSSIDRRSGSSRI